MMTLALLAPVVNLTFEPFAPDHDSYRPTAGPDFEPSAEDEAAAALLLNAGAVDYWPATWPDLLEVGTVSDWDYHAELAHEAERLEAGPCL